MLAIDEADVILFLVEVSTGITDLDTLMADILRRTTKKVILVCNKVDNYDQIYSSHQFCRLGAGRPRPASRRCREAARADLMDAILEALPAETSAQYEDELPRITIVGRPNVGKSSLTNALLGVERNIVTPVAGTTRDSVHTRYNKYGMDFYLVDTAGMRKKGKVTEDLEFYSVMRSIRAIENSDVCVLMLDAEQGLESQDLNIHNLIVRNRKGCVIVVNKMGPDREGEQHDEGVARVPDEETGPVQRHSDHLHFGAEQTAYSGSVADGRARLPVAQAPYPHLGVQRLHDTARDRGDAAALDQRQIHPYQIRHAAAYAHAAVRLLRQPAAVYQASLTAASWRTRSASSGISPASPCSCISGRSNSRRNPRFDIPSEPAFAGAARGFRCGASALRKRVRSAGDTGDKGRLFFRRPHAVVFPGEVTAGEILVSTFPPNLPLPALRAASVAAPRHSASGCARLATRVTKGGFFSASPCSCIFGRSNSRRNPRFDIPSEPAFAGAARGFRCGASAPRKRVRSADDTGDKGRLFPASSCRRISERNNSPEKSVSRHTRTILLPKDGICRCRNFRRIDAQRHGEKRKNDPNACFFARNALEL